MTAHTYPPAVIAAIRAELAGNARRDLVGWAHRVIDAGRVPHDIKRAELVLALEKETKK